MELTNPTAILLLITRGSLEQFDADTGLGPVFNAQSCVICHKSPVTGGASQMTELRVGHTEISGNLINPTVPINDCKDAVSGLISIAERQPDLSNGEIRGQVISSACPRISQSSSRRSLRLEEPAQHSAFVYWRRIFEREGNHKPSKAERHH